MPTKTFHIQMLKKFVFLNGNRKKRSLDCFIFLVSINNNLIDTPNPQLYLYTKLNVDWSLNKMYDKYEGKQSKTENLLLD